MTKEIKKATDQGISTSMTMLHRNAAKEKIKNQKQIANIYIYIYIAKEKICTHTDTMLVLG